MDSKQKLRQNIYLFERRLNTFAKWIAVVAMIAAVAMMFLVVADVFMRRFLNMPILGSNEIQREGKGIRYIYKVAGKRQKGYRGSRK